MDKKKSEFGANFYQFIIENNHIIGLAQAVDLNLLVLPPDDLT